MTTSHLLLLATCILMGVTAPVLSETATSTTARFYRSHNSFTDYFDQGYQSLKHNWWFSGYWANGHPFNVGWDPSYHTVTKDDVLELQMKKKNFYHHTGNYSWTAGEVRSKGFYGAGCYTTCMRPSGESGTSSSFYIINGFFDSEHQRHYNDPNCFLHNEIDIEFVGKDTTKMQSNYFKRHNWRKDPNMNVASGKEEMHDLGYNASQHFNTYSVRWTSWGIQWYVGHKLVRTVYRRDDKDMPDPSFGNVRLSANIWAVVPSAEVWAGKARDSLQETKAEYAWMRFESGENCKIRPECGF